MRVFAWFAVLALVLVSSATDAAGPTCSAYQQRVAPNSPQCFEAATSLQDDDIVYGVQGTGPTRSNQSVKIPVSQLKEVAAGSAPVQSVAGRDGDVTLSTTDISGLGTIATQSAASVAITGGTVTGAAVSGAVVTATGTTTARTLADRFAQTLNIKDFGAVGDGATDDSAALTAAVNQHNTLYAAGTHTCIYAPPGRYKLVTPPPIFSNAGCVVGAGPHKTYFVLDASFVGDLFSWTDAWMASNWPPTGILSVANDASGPLAQGFTVIGNRSASGQQNALMLYDHNDFVLMRDIEVNYMPGRCLGIGLVLNDAGAYTRESRFYNVRCLATGGAGIPSVEVTSSGTGDSSNRLSFDQMDILYPYGPGLVIRSAGTGKAVGNLRFYDLRVEGGYPNSYGGAGDLVQIGDTSSTYGLGVTSTEFTNFIANAGYAGYSTIGIYAPAIGAQPYNITFQGTITSGTGKGVNVQAGRSLRFKLSDIATTDTAFTVGPSTLVGSNIEMDMNGREAGLTTSIDSTSANSIVIPVRVKGPPNIGTVGIFAIDLQGSRGSSAQTAGAQYSNILGGLNNSITSTGIDGTITGGQTNLLAGAFSRVGGNRTYDRGRYGVDCWASGFFFSTQGEAQICRGALRYRSTSTSAARLTADGTGTPSTTAGFQNCWNIPAAYVFNMRLALAGHNVTDGTSSYAWTVPIALFQRPSSGSATLTLGTPVTASTGTGSTTSVSVTADTTNNCLNFSVTPPNADTWDWVVLIDSAESGGN